MSETIFSKIVIEYDLYVNDNLVARNRAVINDSPVSQASARFTRDNPVASYDILRYDIADRKIRPNATSS